MNNFHPSSTKVANVHRVGPDRRIRRPSRTKTKNASAASFVAAALAYSVEAVETPLTEPPQPFMKPRYSSSTSMRVSMALTKVSDS